MTARPRTPGSSAPPCSAKQNHHKLHNTAVHKKTITNCTTLQCTKQNHHKLYHPAVHNKTITNLISCCPFGRALSKWPQKVLRPRKNKLFEKRRVQTGLKNLRGLSLDKLFFKMSKFACAFKMGWHVGHFPRCAKHDVSGAKLWDEATMTATTISPGH